MTTDELITRLKSPDAATRRDAARELGQRRSVEAVAALVEALERQHGESGLAEDLLEHSARAAAAVALGRIGDPRSVDPLLRAARDSFKLGSAASTALGQLVPPPVEALLAATSDSDPWLRTRAASALGEIGDPRAVDILLDLLRDPEDSVRRAAASAFEKLRDARAVAPLVDVLDDPATSDFVRIYAAMALGALGDPRAVDALMRATASASSNVRRASARALCRIDDPRSHALVDRLATDDPDKTVRDVVLRYRA